MKRFLNLFRRLRRAWLRRRCRILAARIGAAERQRAQNFELWAVHEAGRMFTPQTVEHMEAVFRARCLEVRIERLRARYCRHSRMVAALEVRK